jgi:hypothetical protein
MKELLFGITSYAQSVCLYPETQVFEQAVKPEGFQEAVIKRDRSCFITGAEDATVLEAMWIFPPNFAFAVCLAI